MKKLKSLFAIVVFAGAAHAQTFTRDVAVVEDPTSLELEVREAAGALVVDLATAGEPARDGAALVAVISPDSGIDAVTVRIALPAGVRLTYDANVDVRPLFSSSGCVSFEIPVTDLGTARVDYVVERALGTPTIATHGYIKIKKLNSGG